MRANVRAGEKNGNQLLQPLSVITVNPIPQRLVLSYHSRTIATANMRRAVFASRYFAETAQTSCAAAIFWFSAKCARLVVRFG